MPANFDLIVTADPVNHSAELRLLDANGVQLAFQQTDFKAISRSRQQGLFDLRNFIRHYVEQGKETELVAEIGVCIAHDVMGQGIFENLWKSTSQRTLRIQLPGASEEENFLAAALARVPWEIARPEARKPTLTERNLLVRVLHDMHPPASQPLALAADEALRVLFVFAEARGSRPLGARQERLKLVRLFENDIYPKRRVVAHFLTHGVTRERLQDQIQENGGYHIVHWSGHGQLNLLELARPGGARDLISGQELLNLFNDAGGFLPRLFFLGACHSGDILCVKNWNDFLAVAQGKEPHMQEAPASVIDIGIKEQPGYTGTAHALLQGGVPAVVAMRYAVGDAYARELAVVFYRALLADPMPKNVAEALSMARKSLLDGKKNNLAHFAACDHATPLLYGAEQPGLTLVAGVSPAKASRKRRLPEIAELATGRHEHFVGRTWELAGLGADFIGSRAGVEAKPVALITGLGGMGKTALAAEVLTLWETRFMWVLIYQAKPGALTFDATLRDIHVRLSGELGRYHEHVTSNPADAIYREAITSFTGPERLERLTQNLIRAFKDEPILLVLDNFETNLKPQAETSSAARQTAWACQDPTWDRCIAALSTDLMGSPSRVLITCRHPLAALAKDVAHTVLLGPLPATEAALYLHAHPRLRHMVFGGNADEKTLALRLLNASRFHPLLMDRLARLATEPALRPQLLQAMETLEKTRNFAGLPALFATTKGDDKELSYLEGALASSLDQLIGAATPDARRLLWMIAVANEPVTLVLLKGLWEGDSHELQQLRQIKQMLDRLPQLSPQQQAKLNAMSPALRAMVDNVTPELPAKPEIGPLLHHLVTVGLVTAERSGRDDDNPDLSCHELVRERIAAWMRQHPKDCADLTENTMRLAYAERLEAVFDTVQDRSAAVQAGSRALVYFVQAKTLDRLSSFASRLVTSSADPRLLEALIPHLRLAVESASEGEARWSYQCNLADALSGGGHPDASLQFYELAATQARAAAESGNEGARRAWDDLAWITGNWGNALCCIGQLGAARQLQLESAEAARKAGKPAVYVIGSELAVLRIDIKQGKLDDALPQVEVRLAQLDAWWQLHRVGQAVQDAPDVEDLARVFISALDTARQAHSARQGWESALRCVDTVLEIQRALKRESVDIARSRMNRANLLSKMANFGAAKVELEACLELFQYNYAAKSATLSALAAIFDTQGDVAQAILQERRSCAICEHLPDPIHTAVSHGNLAIYLSRSGPQEEIAEALRHQIASLIYFRVSGIELHVKTSLRNYAFVFCRDEPSGSLLPVPKVAELLVTPGFEALRRWLDQRRVNVADLQSDIDHLLKQARQAALSRL